ncbi:MAG: hypothetical protein AAF764_00765 [Pseudomonadota bacterium]
MKKFGNIRLTKSDLSDYSRFMERELLDHLLRCEGAFLEAKTLKPSTLAQKAAGDWRFFDNLRAAPPATFSVRKYDAVMGWFADNWPDEAVRPDALLTFEAQRARQAERRTNNGKAEAERRTESGEAEAEKTAADTAKTPAGAS